jgi:hypothetical protein
MLRRSAMKSGPALAPAGQEEPLLLAQMASYCCEQNIEVALFDTISSH